MQFKNDDSHIRILNTDEEFRLVNQPDPKGQLLAASLVGRTVEQPFHHDELGRVEIRATVLPFSAFLGLKVNQKAVAAAESVWEPFGSEDAWRGIVKYHRIVAGNVTRLQLDTPETTPWLGISIFPEPFAQLSIEFRALVISLLWGRSFRIRQCAVAAALSN